MKESLLNIRDRQPADFSVVAFLVGLLEEMRTFRQEHGRVQLYPVVWEPSRIGPWVRVSDVACTAGLPGTTRLSSRTYAQLLKIGQQAIRRKRKVDVTDLRVMRQCQIAGGTDFSVRLRRWPGVWSTLCVRLVYDVNDNNWIFLVDDAPSVLKWLTEEQRWN